MQDDQKQLPQTVVGGTETLTVLLNDDRQAMGLRFDLIVDLDGSKPPIPIEVVFDTQVGMGLLLNLQEMQKLFDLPIPQGGTFDVKKEKI